MRSLIALVVISSSVIGCASSPPTGFAADLPGTTWTVERVVDVDGRILRTDSAEVTFEADGDLALSSCNLCSGSYAVREAELRIDEPLACTRRACLVDSIELERYFAGPLTLRRDGVYLIVEPGGGIEGAQVHLVPSGGDL